MAEQWAKGWMKKKLQERLPEGLQLPGEVRKHEVHEGDDATAARQERLQQAIRALSGDDESEFIILGTGKLDPETGEPDPKKGEFAWLVEFYRDPRLMLKLLIQALQALGADVRKMQEEEGGDEE